MLPLISFETGRRSQTQSSVRPLVGRDSKWKSGSIEIGTTRREAKEAARTRKSLYQGSSAARQEGFCLLTKTYHGSQLTGHVPF